MRPVCSSPSTTHVTYCPATATSLPSHPRAELPLSSESLHGSVVLFGPPPFGGPHPHRLPPALEWGAILAVSGTRPTASSAGSKRGRRWCGGEVPVTSRHCSAQHWEVTLPSAPLPTNTWAPHWGKTKAYKPQQQNLVLVDMRFDFFRACALLHI